MKPISYPLSPLRVHQWSEKGSEVLPFRSLDKVSPLTIMITYLALRRSVFTLGSLQPIYILIVILYLVFIPLGISFVYLIIAELRG